MIRIWRETDFCIQHSMHGTESAWKAVDSRCRAGSFVHEEKVEACRLDGVSNSSGMLPSVCSWITSYKYHTSSIWDRVCCSFHAPSSTYRIQMPLNGDTHHLCDTVSWARIAVGSMKLESDRVPELGLGIEKGALDTRISRQVD